LHVLRQTGGPAPVQEAAPRRRVGGAGEDQHSVTDGARRSAERPVLADLAAEQLASQVLAHAGRMSSRQDQTIELVGFDVRPPKRRAELLAALHLRVEDLWFSGRAELPEDHAVEQPRVGRGRGAAALGGEPYAM